MTEFLTRPGGTIGYDVAGDGPLVVCIAGMGELRSSYRHTMPALVEASYRVATFDLRGHGDSATTFDAYDDEAAASDALALIEHLESDGAVILGNSMGAAAAVLAAAARPQVVRGMVLLGPFVRNPQSNWFQQWLMSVSLKGFWGRAAWRSYHKSLSPSGEAADTAAHQQAVQNSLRNPEKWQAFQRTATSSHAAAEAALPQLKCPALVVMGSKDRDFSDPADEAKWIASVLNAEVLMVDGAGHYPMAEQPAAVNPSLVAFVTAHQSAHRLSPDA